MKILVTGSSGHLGEALVRTLQPNHEVIGLDITPSKFTSILGSISNRDVVRDSMTGVDIVLHTATLHKPHVISHSRQDFIDTNITGTLNLLEEGVAAGIKAFIFTSTTSVYSGVVGETSGEAPVTWVTEQLPPKPKNIYGVTKIAAENLCELFHQLHKLPCVILRTSRFFPEDDDEEDIRKTYDESNAKVNEFLYRRVELEDVVQAHLLGMEKAKVIGFGKYIVTATTPFGVEDLVGLRTNAPSILKTKYPGYEKLYEVKGWKMFPSIDRVYVNDLARKELGWKPKYDFGYLLRCLEEGKDIRSEMVHVIGKKMYHPQRGNVNGAD